MRTRRRRRPGPGPACPSPAADRNARGIEAGWIEPPRRRRRTGCRATGASSEGLLSGAHAADPLLEGGPADLHGGADAAVRERLDLHGDVTDPEVVRGLHEL